jgi:SAM-dependent methyltransferase
VRGFDVDTYGERIAEAYDGTHGDLPLDVAQQSVLRRYAGGGAALEVGVGTGRVAVPLAAAGVTVIGVDTSAAMLDRFRERAAGLPVHAVHADLADPGPDEAELPPAGPIALAYAVFNTFFMLAGRPAQAALLRRLHALLAPEGALVLEVFVPPAAAFPGGQQVRVGSITADEVWLEVAVLDPAAQRVDCQDIRLRHGQPVRLAPAEIHYLLPDQLDAMATECGFLLEHRWADWEGVSPESAEGRRILIYRKA